MAAVEKSTTARQLFLRHQNEFGSVVGFRL